MTFGGIILEFENKNLTHFWEFFTLNRRFLICKNFNFKKTN